MKKTGVILVLLLGIVSLSAQSTIEQRYELGKNEKLKLKFEYPELVKINTWKKDEVLINAKVFINNVESTENLKLVDSRTNSELSISSQLINIDHLKGRYINTSNENNEVEMVTVNRDGRTITIGGKEGSYYSGNKMSIKLEIFLPESAVVELEVKYGMAEIINTPESLTIDAKYGGADVMLQQSNLSRLEVSTSWGQIFTDLKDLKVGGNDMMGKEMTASFNQPSGRKSILVRSQYGNIYLRNNQP